MTAHHINEISCGGSWDIVRKCICSAFFHQAARLQGLGDYVNARTGVPCHVHPSSSLFGLGFSAEYVVYHDLVLTSKEFMRHATAVDAPWLAEFGPMFYKVKTSVDTRVQVKAAEDAEMDDMEREMLTAHDELVRKKAAREEARKRTSRKSRIIMPGRGARKRSGRFGM